MLPKDGVDLLWRAMRTPGSRPGRARNGFHSPILTDPRAERMTGPPDGYGARRDAYANDANPFEYMLAVVRNQEAARADPGSWMPWNYRERLVQTAPPRAP